MESEHQRLLAQGRSLLGRMRRHPWFPHVPLALLLGLGGLWLLHAAFGAQWLHDVNALAQGRFHLNLGLLPSLLIGGGMVIMAFGLLWRSRLAWAMAVLLAATGLANTIFASHIRLNQLLAYFAFMLLALLFAWRRFDRSSVAAGTLFALTSMVMVLMYATFGSYYLGAQFKPAITNLITALYFSMVTMSTVGYGDIVPTTSEARLFIISMIALGVAVFATSLTAVIAPLMGHSLQRILNRRGPTMKREDHFVVIGSSPLAENTWQELDKRKQPVTRLLREQPLEGQLKGVDFVIGDPNLADVLREAGADRAKAVLAMLTDDSENAFIVLAVKALEGTAKSVAAVNDVRHLGHMKLVNPDVVIAPQVLGGELMAMMLSGEQITPEFVMQRVFQRSGAEAARAAASPN
jgi:voltage-gated potassium channel